MSTTPPGPTPSEAPSPPPGSSGGPAAPGSIAGDAETAAPGPETTSPQASQAWLSVFLSTATTVFLAELGDKTQLAALLLSAESGRPAVVFVGASLALISSSLVGVLLGRWLSTLLPPAQLERGAGVLMVALGLWLGRQAVLHLAPLAASTP